METAGLWLVMKRRVSADDPAVCKGQAPFILPQLLIICFIIRRSCACWAASAALTVERNSPQIKATINKIRTSMEQTEAACSFLMGHTHTHFLGFFLSMTLLQQKVCVPRVDALVPADLGEEEKRCTFSLWVLQLRPPSRVVNPQRSCRTCTETGAVVSREGGGRAAHLFSDQRCPRVWALSVRRRQAFLSLFIQPPAFAERSRQCACV